MYRFLIVDDEIVERQAIRFLLQQHNFQFELQEASNGRDALKLLSETQYDILFTDIQMPFLNGILLANQARKLYPDIQIIFFSGYDDFTYAKEALSIHAVNYILKPINDEEFVKTISDVLERIRALEHFNNRKKAADELTRNHIFYQLINSTDIAQLMAQYPQLDFSFVFDCHRLFLIQLEKDFFFPAPFTDILPKDSYLVNLNPAQNLLFFAGARHHLPWYQNLADKMRSYMIKEYGINARIAMSQPITHPKDLPAAFKEMEQYLMDQFFFSKNTLLSAEIPAPDITETVPETDDTLLKDIQTAIGLKDAFSVEKNLSLLLDSCKKRPNVSYIYFRFLCTNILKLLLDGLAENSGRSFESYAHLIYQSKHISEIEALLLPLVKRLSAKLEKEQDAPNYALCMVKQYIHKHYGEDLSLDILAKEVYLTPHYLSALFIEETGCGINRYIKNVRMEKAKDLLLHTNLKINDICRQVGYSNLSYFCKSFAEEFGTTPNNYRNSTSAERKPK